MSQSQSAAMFANWPQRFTEALRRREDSAKGICSRLGAGADVLMLACQIYGPAFTMEVMHPGSELAQQVALADAFKRFVADMDGRLAA